MSSRSIRIVKEARLVMWTWLAVMVTAFLKTLSLWYGRPNDLLAVGSATGFLLGIPLLANVAFGEEFHHRTISLLLSQPRERMQLWSEKWFVLIAAVSSSTLIYWLTWRQQHLSDEFIVPAVIWAVASVCAAAFWTLETRSTMGGVALNVIMVSILYWALVIMNWVFGVHVGSTETLPTAVSVLVLGYGAIMFGLARRQFAKLEVLGSGSGEDLLAGKTRGLVRLTALRCRRSGATLNLVRKELRFLWPVWMLTALSILFIIGISGFRALQAATTGPPIFYSAAGQIFILYGILPALLAGSLSMGEERTSGTHTWNLTLPMSTRRQWLVKLAVAVIGNAVCVTMVAVGAFIFMEGPLATTLSNFLNRDFPALLLFSTLITVAAFWCACAIKGTVNAVLAVVLGGTILFMVVGLGMATAFHAGTLRTVAYISSVVHPFPFSNSTWGSIDRMMRPGGRDYTWIMLAIPILAVALSQTRRLFGKELSGGAGTLVRSLAIVLVVAFVSSSLYALPRSLFTATYNETRQVLTEAAKAIEAMHIDPASLGSTSPRTLTFADLNHIVPMSPLATRWLQNATISLTNKPFAHRVYRPPNFEIENFPYAAVVHLPKGWDCSIFPGYSPAYYFCTSTGDPSHPETWGRVMRE